MRFKTNTKKFLDPQILLMAICAPILVWTGNPAIALLVGAAVSLSCNRVALVSASLIGKIALQTAIVLLGFKLNAATLMQISADYSLVVSLYVVAVLALGLTLGVLLKTHRDANQLISSGTAICGGTTIASLSPVINARPEQTGVALTLVFLLNAVALFLFPHIGRALELTQSQFGLWAALAIHDTSSVVATAALYGEEAATIATTVKLGRTLWLIPLLLLASIANRADGTRVRLPLFVVLFVIAACSSSFIPVGNQLMSIVHGLSKALLVVALFCIGMDIRRETLRQLNSRVVIHALLLWALAAPTVLLLVLRFSD